MLLKTWNLALWPYYSKRGIDHIGQSLHTLCPAIKVSPNQFR
jgi:hypothetical protein